MTSSIPKMILLTYKTDVHPRSVALGRNVSALFYGRESRVPRSKAQVL